MEAAVNSQSCRICGGSRPISIPMQLRGGITSDERYLPGISPAWLFCPRCGALTAAGGIPDIEAFYRDDYAFLLESTDIEPAVAESQKKYSEVLADLFLPHIGKRQGTLLDIGAGKGNFLIAMHQVLPDLELHAVEPSQAFAKLRAIPFLKSARQAFFSAKDHAGTEWDHLSLIGVLEHVPDPGLFLTEIRSIMNDSTLLLIEVPNFRNNTGDWLVVDHLTKFTPENLEQLLLSRGFAIVEKRVTESVPMQFIVKKGPVQPGDYSGCKPVDISADDVLRFIKDVSAIGTDCVFFGGNSFSNYLVHAEPDFARRVKAMVNDNRFYQGRNYLDTEIPVVGYEEFKAKFSGLPVILALGRGYYGRVLPRLQNEKVIRL
ncbi:MAG: class I SAM-dependent methyltransferase [Lentisphaeria bacterium]|nr:class I SAM-dependent methyltransferase [Lentisphaeria bacterium]